MDQISLNLIDPTSKLYGLQREYVGKIMALLCDMEATADDLEQINDVDLIKVYVAKIEELDAEILANYEIVKGIEERTKQYEKVS